MTHQRIPGWWLLQNLRAVAVTLALPIGLLTEKPAASQAIELEEIWSTPGDPAVVEFAYINSMIETATGEIWVADDLNKVVIGVTGSGRVNRIVAREGGGPGEIRAAQLFAPTPDGGIALYDIGRPGFHVWDASGEFERTVPAPLVMNPKGFAVLPDGSFVLSGGMSGRAGAVHSFTPDGERRGSVHSLPEIRPGHDLPGPSPAVMAAGGPLTVSQDGSLLFSEAAPLRIMEFGTRTGRGRTIVEDPEALPPIGDDFMQFDPRTQRTTINWFFPQTRAILELPNGHLLNVAWFRQEERSLWDIYDRQGNRIARANVNRPYEVWALTSDGDVLASYRHPVTDEHVAVRLRMVVR